MFDRSHLGLRTLQVLLAYTRRPTLKEEKDRWDIISPAPMPLLESSDSR